MAGIAQDTLVRRAAGQVSCPLRDETAILNLRTDAYYGLNAVGTRVWELLAAPRRISDLRDALLAEFDVSRESCEQDLEALMADLLKADLIEVLSETVGASLDSVRE